MMPQNLTGCNPSLNFSLLSALSTLYYLDRHEPLSFALQYPQTRKALGYGIGEFKKIYTAYVKQRGGK
jgi:hypothetical protein